MTQPKGWDTGDKEPRKEREKEKEDKGKKKGRGERGKGRRAGSRKKHAPHGEGNPLSVC